MAGTDPNPKLDKSLFSLISDLPGIVTRLAKDELALLKAELTAKLAHLGIGIGLFAVAGFFAFFAFAVLIAAAVLGIAVALPAWLAALIVAGALLVITAVLVLVGVVNVRRGVPPVPEESIENIKKDVNAFRGLGQS